MAEMSDTFFTPIWERAGVIPALSARVNVANRLLAILHEETILSVASVSYDAAKAVELKVGSDCALAGIPLSELQGKLPPNCLIAMIESRGQVMIGKGHRMLSPGDHVVLLCESDQIPTLPRLFH
jgi:trk system potassium uptake protein TrkA